MAVTYEQAREAVRATVGPTWTVGSFVLDDRQIVENDHEWAFNVGAREYLVDGDRRFAVIGGVPVVDKKTGEVGWRASVEVATSDAYRQRPNPDPTFRPAA